MKKLVAAFFLSLIALPALAANSSLFCLDGSKGGIAIGTATCPSSVAIDTGSTTGAITIPVGTTGARPASPASGMIRYNSTTGTPEGYASSAWRVLGYIPQTLPKYKSGNYYVNGTGTVGTSLLATQGRLWATPYIVPVPTTFSKIGIYVTTAGSGSEAKFCVYDSTGTGGLPGALVSGGTVNTGVATTTLNSTASGTFASPITLWGFYWIATMHSWSTTAPTVHVRGSVVPEATIEGDTDMYNADGGGAAGAARNPYADVTYASGCPASFGTPTGYTSGTNLAPIMGLAVQ